MTGFTDMLVRHMEMCVNFILEGLVGDTCDGR
jgi:hypothetical protein